MQMKYRIFLNSQLGVREGELVLNIEQGEITGTLLLLGFKNSVNGKCIGQTYYLQHKLHTLTRELCCSTVFEINEDKLFGIVETENIKMKLHGCAISENKQSERSEEKECRT